MVMVRMRTAMTFVFRKEREIVDHEMINIYNLPLLQTPAS